MIRGDDDEVDYFMENEENDDEDNILTENKENDEDKKYGETFQEIKKSTSEENYTNSWGPEEFKKKYHPLALMV